MRWRLTIGLLAGLAAMSCGLAAPKPPAATKPQLAFVDGGAIWTIQSDGMNRRRLTGTRNNTSPAWSRDGEQIVFIRGNRRGDFRGTLHRIPAAGGSPQKVVEGACWSPLWSPVKDELAYVRSERAGEPAGTHIAFVDPNGRPTRPSVFHHSSRVIHGPLTRELCDWSRDGLRLSTQVELYFGFDIDGIKLTNTGFEPLVLSQPDPKIGRMYENNYHGWCPSDPDRDLLVRFVATQGLNHDLDIEVSVGPAGKQDRVVVARPELQPRQNILDSSLRASWSPDGREIAYESEGKIFITNVENPKPRLLTTGSHPRWRPQAR
ncbi:MAG: hypothetical protein ACK47B_07640 [Armatimonadota bacterium]